MKHKPNPNALLGDGDDGEYGEGEGGLGQGSGAYRPPRMAAVHYEEEKGAGRRERQKVSLIYIAYKIYIYCILYQV